jgi:hypothetical protein
MSEKDYVILLLFCICSLYKSNNMLFVCFVIHIIYKFCIEFQF